MHGVYLNSTEQDSVTYIIGNEIWLNWQYGLDFTSTAKAVVSSNIILQNSLQDINYPAVPSVTFNNKAIDNGQHIMLGAYKNLFELIRIVGLNELDILLRKPLKLIQKSTTDGQDLVFTATNTMPPFHLLGALLGAKGISRRDKRNAIIMWLRLTGRHFRLAQDTDVKSFLYEYKQSDNIINKLWNFTYQITG